MEFLTEPSIKSQSEIMELTRELSRMDPIITYLKNDNLPEEKMETRILRLKTTRYVLYGEKLYKRDYSMPLLKRVGDPRGHM